jgi:hypothetical protein
MELTGVRIMAYDEGLAQRLRELLAEVVPTGTLGEKKMFGGLAFMSRGHMAVGIVGHALMARVGPQRHDEALARPHVRPMDFTGRPMAGYVFVDPPGIESDAELSGWIRLGFDFVATLPLKD